MNKRTLIVEGPNGHGKDVYINTLLKYCPYYKVHYAGSNVLKEFKSLDKFDYSKIGLVTFETLFASIEKDSTKYPHIQYRSLITNYIYNSLFRFDEDVKKLDYDYMMRFFNDKYTEDYVLWISTYSDEYLKNVSDEELNERLRHREKEIQNIHKINSAYNDVADLLRAKGLKCTIEHTKGSGSLDILKALDEQIEEIVDSHKDSAVFVVSDVFQKSHKDSSDRIFQYAPDQVVYLNSFDSSVQSTSLCNAIKNPYPNLIFDDFFHIYVVCNLSKCLNVEHQLPYEYSYHIETFLNSDQQTEASSLKKASRKFL